MLPSNTPDKWSLVANNTHNCLSAVFYNIIVLLEIIDSLKIHDSILFGTTVLCLLQIFNTCMLHDYQNWFHMPEDSDSYGLIAEVQLAKTPMCFIR